MVDVDGRRYPAISTDSISRSLRTSSFSYTQSSSTAYLLTNTIMHPPLDRPHPDCQTEINNLRHCHETTSKLKFWGCNDIKFALDKCLKEEKIRLLEILNKDMVEKRAAEEDVYQMAMGKTTSFEDYLKMDKDFVKAMEERRKRDSSMGQ